MPCRNDLFFVKVVNKNTDADISIKFTKYTFSWPPDKPAHLFRAASFFQQGKKTTAHMKWKCSKYMFCSTCYCTGGRNGWEHSRHKKQKQPVGLQCKVCRDLSNLQQPLRQKWKFDILLLYKGYLPPAEFSKGGWGWGGALHEGRKCHYCTPARG